MKIVFSDAAKERVERDLEPNKALVLDFDDGVGPFSDEATCTLDVAFNLIVVDPEKISKDFDEMVPSNLGQVYVKGYAINQLDENASIDLDKYLRFQLKGDSGMIDPNMSLQTR